MHKIKFKLMGLVLQLYNAAIVAILIVFMWANRAWNPKKWTVVSR